MAKRHRIVGTRTLYLLPAIPDDLPPAVKNALAIRNAATTAGRCPSCGAEPELYRDREHDGIMHLVFRHEDECGALRDGDEVA